MDAIVMKKANELAEELAGQATTLEDLNGVMRSLMKSALERMLNTELEVHLGRGSSPAVATPESSPIPEAGEALQRRNRKNGTSPKTIQGDLGKLPLDIPRDRNGTFEPQLMPKYQRRLSGFDEKILALYAKGMTTRDIQDLVKQLYDVDVSPSYNLPTRLRHPDDLRSWFSQPTLLTGRLEGQQRTLV